jgi:OmpA-OmpF porin, OOP family
MVITLKKVAIATFSTLILGACASAPEADISPTANPNDEITKLESDITKGFEKQYDVLAYSDFRSSQESLKDAKEELKDGDDQADIIETISEARGYYQRAAQTADQRADKVESVINARQAALDAGARKFPQENEKLNDIDEDLRDQVTDIADMEPKDFNELQQRYLKLEVASVNTAQLGKARAQIQGAIRGDAEDNTPKTLAKAKRDLVNAENMITANVRNPSGYSAAVAKANSSARLLDATLAASKRDGTVLPESVALEIVSKDKSLNMLNDQLDNTQSELSTTRAVTRTQRSMIDLQKGALSQQQMSIQMNNAIKSVAKDFSKDEAEVYRQGDKLLFRLKGINFSSGRSDLPGNSMALLEKVKEVAEDLNATEVVVEGHTDAVGAAAPNKELSQKRAEAVAKYFASNGIENDNIEAVGYGFEKPLTTNKTKEGRATNRRVDVLITPSFQAKSDSTTSQVK